MPVYLRPKDRGTYLGKDNTEKGRVSSLGSYERAVQEAEDKQGLKDRDTSGSSGSIWVGEEARPHPSMRIALNPEIMHKSLGAALGCDPSQS